MGMDTYARAASIAQRRTRLPSGWWPRRGARRFARQGRLADEYDAAQERGEIPQQDAHVSDDNMSTTDFGLRHDQIHEARQIRDAEVADHRA